MKIKRRPPETSAERVTVDLTEADIEMVIRFYLRENGEELPKGRTHLWGLVPDRDCHDSEIALTLCIDVTEPDG